MNTKQAGNLGERIAENFLKNKGYQILDRNFIFRVPGSPQKGEIDIVSKKRDTVSFIEVKTLTGNKGEQFSFISPEEKVDFSKQRKLIRAAESWLMRKKIPLNSKWQIDIIAIEIREGKTKLSHFENAISYL